MIHGLDIFTLLAAVTVTAITTTMLLLFFRLTQKTYTGFGFWILGSLLVSLGYGSLFFRQVTPLWANVLTANLSFLLAAILRAQGVSRFMSGKALSWGLLALYPLVITAALIFLLTTGATAAQRNLLFSFGIFPLIWLISQNFILYHPEGKERLYISAALINGFFGVMIVLRAIAWGFRQEQTFTTLGAVNSIHCLLAMAYEIGLTIFFLMMNNQRTEQELHDAMAELKQTSGTIKTLSGLLPICASCKKIRDDKGYWGQVEEYLREHTDAEFTHGICPDCARKLYPEVSLEELGEEDR